MNLAKSTRWPRLPVQIGPITVALDPTWLIVLPVGLWAVTTLYVPILGSFLSPLQTGLVAALVLLFVVISLSGHVLAHRLVARVAGSESPVRTSIFLFGDAAQAWPAAPTPWRELGVAWAGCGFNLLLAGLAYLGWNAQVTPVLNLSLLFAVAFNAWLVVINLIPAFPLDGGRAARGIFWLLAAQPTLGGRLARSLGVAIPIGLSAWAVFLLAEHTRFSVPTAGTTFGFALLLVAGQLSQTAWVWDRPVVPMRRSVGALVAVIFVLAMLGVGASLVLTNDGIEAPGLALSVEPMVAVDAAHRHDHPGTFILTSVVSQTPILGVEWALAKVDPAVRLVPPESVVPENATPQSLARQGFQQLDESTATATVVGLREAGFDARFVGKGAAVTSIVPGSPALGRLQPGDVITTLNGNPVRTTGDLIQGIQGLDPHATAQLQIERGGQSLNVALALLPPDATNSHPHIGIAIESAGADSELPFPVKITPQKIVGGPSAGLMFTLTVYNLVSPTDLTGGRKIAGTGTINMDGTVGPIGGVEQKVAAAEAAGAAYFFSPPDNYAAALSVARHITVVKIATVEEAIAFLRALPASY